MKQYCIIIFIMLVTESILSQEVISTQGDSYSNANGSIDFTIGEIIINTVNEGSNDITQGFHQTNWNFLAIEDHAPDFEVSIFPNPTEDVLNIRTETFENISYAIYDQQGKLVLSDILSATLNPILVNHLAPGSYSLNLYDKTQTLKTFKLIKHH